jgi:23S rRNA pseudouridine2605 synthase
MSRSEAERSVLAGRVTLNGKPTNDPERPCHPERDTILLDGRPLRAVRRVYLAMNKPRGAITTAHDPEGRPTAYAHLPKWATGLQAVGRLDADTTGLLLFTNDSDFASAVTESASGVEKEYEVLIDGPVKNEDTRTFERGVALDGRKTLPARCRVMERGEGGTRVRIVIVEGRNRQIRRMWEVLGYRVLELHRTRIGPIELRDLEPGRVRTVLEFERSILRPPDPNLDKGGTS